ncbi:MAG TPA: NUDIX hydrolase [Acidimicrobiales bacterium]|nr:NUDIX hydrolase [Acidimicrobiales bacterium]
MLLLKRAGGALSGQWFLPGGAVDRGELPEDGARRELVEESGLDIDGELELVGAYPMWVYGGDCLQLSYRGKVTDGDVQGTRSGTSVPIDAASRAWVVTATPTFGA